LTFVSPSHLVGGAFDADATLPDGPRQAGQSPSEVNVAAAIDRPIHR
jgi:hypothetical protein